MKQKSTIIPVFTQLFIVPKPSHCAQHRHSFSLLEGRACEITDDSLKSGTGGCPVETIASSWGILPGC